MGIRWKLLILLLGISLAPVIVVAALVQRGMRSLGEDLATNARSALTERTAVQLQQLIRDKASVVKRQRESLEFILRAQARAVERRLASPPGGGEPVFFSEDFDRRDPAIPGLETSQDHFRFVGADARPIRLTYDAQVYKLAPGVTLGAVPDDIRRLADMPGEYGFLRQAHPDEINWQFTALQSGIHTSYPGHGGYPEEFDPRDRQWYAQARSRGTVNWIGPYIDASSQQLTLTVSTPVFGPDGAFAGVTGIDVTVATIVETMKLPPIWPQQTKALLVVLSPVAVPEISAVPTPTSLPGVRGEQRVAILAQPGEYHRGERWNEHIDAEFLEADDPRDTARLVSDMANGLWGKEEMRYHDRAALWVYGPVDSAGTYLVLILPYEEVVADAVEAERSARERTQAQTQVNFGLAGVVFLAILLCALVGSRTVTRPVRDLAAAAEQIAKGEFEARVPIRTRDEIGRLGRRFNEMIPQLEERMNLKHALELAMEVQQSLLPAGPPNIQGLDIAGTSVYCDETGGDYFDFLQLTQVSPRQVGVAIGDVTGHGIAAALLMTTARALLRSRASDSTSLSRLIGDMNRHMVADMEGGQFMTMFYLVIDAVARKAHWISAGHDAAIVYHPGTGEFKELEGANIPLGIEPEWEFTENGPSRLHEGEIILIGTDGIWECRNVEGEFFGKQRLKDVLRRNAGATAGEITASVIEALAEFRGERAQEDDITLIVIRVTSE